MVPVPYCRLLFKDTGGGRHQPWSDLRTRSSSFFLKDCVRFLPPNHRLHVRVPVRFQIQYLKIHKCYLPSFYGRKSMESAKTAHSESGSTDRDACDGACDARPFPRDDVQPLAWSLSSPPSVHGSGIWWGSSPFWEGER